MTSEEFVEYIIGNTVKRTSLQVKEFPLFDKPIVYLAVGESEAIYVGMSRRGIARIFRDHEVISKLHKDIVSIELYETATIKDAIRLETALINEFRPKYNNRKKPKKNWSTSKLFNYIQASGHDLNAEY